MDKHPENLASLVKLRYGKIAEKMQQSQEDSCCTSDCCTTETADVVSRAPLSLGCDLRLVDVAAPQENEIVIDLGSGSGHDTRTISSLLGETGKIIGVDFGSEMIELAREKSKEFNNIHYIQADIKSVPLEDNVADLIVSNCVFNLVQEKDQVFNEVFRLLKPGGRMVVSDMITMSDEVEITGEDYCACIGGATSLEEYIDLMKQTGFINIDTIKEYESSYKGQAEMVNYQSVLFIGYKPEN